MSRSVLTSRARLASLHRDHTPDSAIILDARRDLALAKLEQFITRTVAEAPPLSQEQLDRIARLLRKGA